MYVYIYVYHIDRCMPYAYIYRCNMLNICIVAVVIVQVKSLYTHKDQNFKEYY